MGNYLREVSQSVRRLKHQAPDLYVRWFKRIYPDIPGFTDWRQVCLYFAACELEGYQLLSETSDVSSLKKFDKVSAAQIATDLARYACPLFYVSEDLLQACERTTLTGGLAPEEYRMPFQSFVFVFPKSPEPEAPAFLAVSYEPGDDKEYQFWTGEEFVNNAGEPTVTFTAYLDNRGVIFTTRASFRTLAGCLADDDWSDQRLRESGVEVDPNHAHMTEYLGKLTFNLLLAMQVRPELVEAGGPVKAPRRQRDIAKEFWTPNFVGRTYRVQGRDLGGTHASPRMHWRRGHWRRQRLGSRTGAPCLCTHNYSSHWLDKDRGCGVVDCECRGYVSSAKPTYKLNWIEPCLVAAKAPV